jgi:PEP-CTERM motif
MRMCVLALSAVLCLPASLMADTIFSNFGPGDPFSNAPSADIGGMPGQVQTLAAPFIADETAVLSDIELPLFKLSSNPPPFSVYIASSLSNGEPGALLEQLTQTSAAGLTSSLIEFTCSTCPQLDEGTTYFVIAVPSTGGDPLDVTDWNKIANNPTPFYFNESGTASAPWLTDGTGALALQVYGSPVTGSPVPEPSAVVLLATGFAALAGDLFRRRRTM